MTYKLSEIQHLFMVGFVLLIKEVNSLTHRYSYGLQTNDDNVLVCYRLWFVNAVIKVNRQKCQYLLQHVLFIHYFCPRAVGWLQAYVYASQLFLCAIDIS